MAAALHLMWKEGVEEGSCDVCLFRLAAGRADEDVGVIADVLGEGIHSMAGRPCSGRVSGLRAGLQRGVSADGQRKRPHPLKDREEGILRQSRYGGVDPSRLLNVYCPIQLGVAPWYYTAVLYNNQLYVLQWLFVFCSEVLLLPGDLTDLRPAPPPQQPLERMKTAVSGL